MKTIKSTFIRNRIITILMLLAAIAIATTPDYGQNPLTKIKKAFEKAVKKPQNTATTSTSAPSAATSTTGQPLNAKVQETLMGPSVTGYLTSRTYMSEDGDHLAVVTAKGSREVVLIDGVEGPVFDEIPKMGVGINSGAVQFSPTGGRSAYVGRRGGDMIAVVDGKETGVLATVPNLQSVYYSDQAAWKFWFNHDGSRLAYAAVAGPGAWVMVVDGVKSPSYRSIDFRQTLLNGNRLIYLAQTEDQQWHAVVDAKPGPGYAMISSLNLTPDGVHYAYLAQPIGGPKTIAVIDGVENGKNYLGVGDIELAPDGRVAYVGVLKQQDPGAHGGGSGALVISGKEFPGSCGMGSSPNCLTFANRLPGGNTSPYRHISWSPDGKSFAFIQPNTPNPGVTVMVNGKPMGLTYSAVSQLQWSPDGKRFTYLGNSPTGFFQVVDGEELPTINDVPEFQFSPDGKRYAFQGKSTVIVDGKEQPKTQGMVIRELFRWSSDSKHFAYGAQVNFANYGLVVDGEVKPVFLGDFMAMNQVQPPIIFPSLLFSPDGNHLAYMGMKYDATGRVTGKATVFVDDVSYEGPGQSYTFPSFSPDGKHFAAIITTGQGWTVMIDGKTGPYYEAILPSNIASCRFVNDHEFRFYGIKGGQIYRVTLDL